MNQTESSKRTNSTHHERQTDRVLIAILQVDLQVALLQRADRREDGALVVLVQKIRPDHLLDRLVAGERLNDRTVSLRILSLVHDGLVLQRELLFAELAFSQALNGALLQVLHVTVDHLRIEFTQFSRRISNAHISTKHSAILWFCLLFFR